VTAECSRQIRPEKLAFGRNLEIRMALNCRRAPALMARGSFGASPPRAEDSHWICSQ